MPLRRALDAVAPRSCIVCGTVAQAVLCRLCGDGVAVPGRHRALPGIAASLVLADYRAARPLVLALKRGDWRVAEAGGAALAAALRQHDGPLADLVVPDAVVTWAPTGRARARRRGGDQAEVLARAMARHAGLRCRRLLWRRWGSGPQHGRSGSERLHGPSFTAWRSVPPVVLVVDDVVTTGATLCAAAAALRARRPDVVVGAVALTGAT